MYIYIIYFLTITARICHISATRNRSVASPVLCLALMLLRTLAVDSLHAHVGGALAMWKVMKSKYMNKTLCNT